MHNIGSNSHRRLIDANAVTARGGVSRSLKEAVTLPAPRKGHLGKHKITPDLVI